MVNRILEKIVAIKLLYKDGGVAVQSKHFIDMEQESMAVLLDLDARISVLESCVNAMNKTP